MTDNENNLLAVFEERVRDLLKSCDDKNRRIEELEISLKEKNEEIQQSKQKFEALESKYKNLLMARRLIEDKEEFENAHKRINKLVREIDTCIALLNE